MFTHTSPISIRISTFDLLFYSHFHIWCPVTHSFLRVVFACLTSDIHVYIHIAFLFLFPHLMPRHTFASHSCSHFYSHLYSHELLDCHRGWVSKAKWTSRWQRLHSWRRRSGRGGLYNISLRAQTLCGFVHRTYTIHRKSRHIKTQPKVTMRYLVRTIPNWGHGLRIYHRVVAAALLQ